MHLSRFILFFSTICLVAHLCSPHSLAAQEPTPRPTFANERSDLNQDNVVDADDLLILMQDWGVTSGPLPTATQTATPTPTETPTLTQTQTPGPTETPTTADFDTITIPLPNLPAGARPMRLVRIPGGSFQMGSPDTERGRDSYEGPVHTVNIGYDFYMGETEVTQGQWEAIMGSNPAAEYSIGSEFAAYMVSWNDITRSNGFLDRLNALGRGTFRLPSEAEWEYACRAGTTTRFSFGDNLDCDDACGPCPLADQYMWTCWPPDPAGPKRVAERLPNSYGLYDMHGNLAEWCEDIWHEDYVGAPTDGAAWSVGGSHLTVIRGGSWFGTNRFCRSASRTRLDPTYRYVSVGFRVVRAASP